MERDDLIVNDQYALDAHHSEEDGVKIRKKIVFVTLLLTAITFVEVMMGVFIKRADTIGWEMTKWAFILLTMVKAGYIVMTFMHLGDERKNLRNFIIIPYFIFILYLIFIGLTEGNSVLDLRTPDTVIEQVAE
ncbi:MAG: cytochrome C oxidase subunit IV family protein [Flavobacteriales bacterium]|nr:cytochrome C oxidase subunit IV family protein [Flavobacteriales bacterium]